MITLPALNGVDLGIRPSLFEQNDHLKSKLSLLLSFCDETRTITPIFIGAFSSL